MHISQLFFFFFFKDTAPPDIYTTYDTLSLHDALPISRERLDRHHGRHRTRQPRGVPRSRVRRPALRGVLPAGNADRRHPAHGDRQSPRVTPERGATERRDRAAARDPVGVRLDSEPPPAARLVWSGYGAGPCSRAQRHGNAW